MQCGYFSSMFGGQWKEADENCVFIDIPDENIDKDGVNATYVILSHLITWTNVMLEDIHICKLKFW